MTRAWWPIGCAAAFFILATAIPARAQTFVVRGAPAGGTLEVVFDSATGSGPVDQEGDGTVQLASSPATAGEVAATIFADACGTTVRVVLTARTEEPPAPAAGCQRRAVPGYFVFRRGTSIVLELTPNVPIVRIRQGRVPEAWLTDEPVSMGRRAPRGLVVYGAGGFGTADDTLRLMCGNTSPCARENTKLNFNAGATFWLTPWLGIDGTFLKASRFRADGTGDDYEMIARFTPRALAVSVMGGFPIGPVRFYGRAGSAYHKGKVETTQATYSRTIPVAEGGTITYPASTQVFVYETEGWGRLLGFGTEGWVADNAALFAEVTFSRLDGQNAGTGGERIMDDRLRSIFTGVKVHLGRQR